MAEIIPPLGQQVLRRMTNGEKRFAWRLRDLLEDDYLCWYDIPVGKQRRYPDFILLHPGRGLLFLEVKDWKPSTLKKINSAEVELLTDSGRKTVANPFVQVRQYAYQALKLFDRDTQLHQPDGPHRGKLIFPYGWGIVLSEISRKQIEQAIPDESQRQKLLPDHLVIYKDEMTESADPEAFQERLWAMFQYRFREKLTLPQIDRIRWHLFPEIRIEAPAQEDLFSASSADTDELQAPEPEQTLPEIIRIMDVKQEQLARSLGEGHRIIHGVAGSGKTLILGYRAEMLARTSSEPVLILCFNTSLAAHLRALMQLKGLSEKVKIHHFHEWCGIQLRTYQVNLIPGPEPYFEREVLSVIAGVDSGQIPAAQYSAVLIDEGHDFEAEWLKLVVQMINPDTRSFLLLYDDAQKIYQKKAGLGFSLSSVGIQAQGRTTVLKLNYRNTREILSFAYRFAAECFAHESQGGDFHVIRPEAAGSRGTPPEVFQFAEWQQELAYVVDTLKNWHEQGVPWGSMAIIYVAGWQGKGFSQALRSQKIPNLWMASREYKRRYDPALDQVTILTIQSSKGLEFPNVVMSGLNQLGANDPDQDIRLAYVGMTRAQEVLQLTLSGPDQDASGTIRARLSQASLPATDNLAV